jgi:hypothetical protein
LISILLKVESLRAENDFVNEQMTNMKGRYVIHISDLVLSCNNT